MDKSSLFDEKTFYQTFLEHFEFLLLDQSNPISRAGHFNVLFDASPTYQEILLGTQDLAYIVKLNEVFMQSKEMLAAEF